MIALLFIPIIMCAMHGIKHANSFKQYLWRIASYGLTIQLAALLVMMMNVR